MSGSSQVSARSRNILIVDDDPVTRKLLSRELAALDANVIEAKSGEEALAFVERLRPDLMTVDVEMPGLNGYDLCQRMAQKTHQLDIPIIMLSSLEGVENRRRALKAGAIEYFAKPFAPGSLREVAESLLERIEANRSRMIYSLDSDSDVTQAIDQCLRKHGYRHESFGSPGALCTRLRTQACDLLLLDFQLPKHGTYEVLDALKRLPESTHFAIIGLAEARDHRSLMNPYHSGAKDILLKPFSLEELVVRVDHQLSELSDEAELRRLATVDPLTLIYNRGEISRQLQVELQRALRDESDLGILMLDIDHFKKLNDTYGHAFGDTVLRGVAQRVRELVRPVDPLGRYGGEEFLLLMPRASPRKAKLLAERIRTSIAQLEFPRAESTVRVTISIGAKTWSHKRLTGAETFSTLIEPADRALYAAKAAGRNRSVTDAD